MNQIPLQPQSIQRIYSKLKQHQRALQIALQSIECSVGKQLVIAYHNAAIEYKALSQDEQSKRFHEKAYEQSVELFGHQDPLTQKLTKYVEKLPPKQIPVQNKFRLRSASRHGEETKSFYYKRPISRIDSFTQSLNQSINQSDDANYKSNSQIKGKRQKTLNQSFLTSSNDFNEEEECVISKQLQNEIETQSKIRQRFLQSIHQQNIQLLERKLKKRNSYHINFSQESIVNVECQDQKSQDFIHFENQQPDGQFDSMIPINQQEDLTYDDQELIINQIRGFESQKEITFASFANQETFENTFEQKNKQGNAICKIQKWYRKKQRNHSLKNNQINPQVQAQAALKIQRSYRRMLQQRLMQLKKKNKKYVKYLTISKLSIENEQEYCLIIAKKYQNEILYVINELKNKRQRKRAKVYRQSFELEQLHSKYRSFDEFCQKTNMSARMNLIAYKQARAINYKEISTLFYVHNNQLNLYGVTDALSNELMESDIDEKTSISSRRSPIKLTKLMKLQSLLRGYLARKQQELIKNQKYKHKRFIEKIQGGYFILIFKEENVIQFYNLQQKNLCENEMIIPDSVIKFFGPINRQNCSEIFYATNNKILFTDDAQYIIDKDTRSKEKIDYTLLERAAKKIQRVLRTKIKFFDSSILKYKAITLKAKQCQLLFKIRKSILFEQKYHIILTASGQIYQEHQELLIEGGIVQKKYSNLKIAQCCQRLFQDISISDFTQVTKIILDEIDFEWKNEKLHLKCHSLEEVYGFLMERNYSSFKESLKDAANKEPTFLGRNYLSRKIYCQQYLKNRFEIEDRPTIFCTMPDPSVYQITYIKNLYLERLKKKYEQKRKDKQVGNNINHYVNKFPSVFNYEWIQDPDELYLEMLNKKAKLVQRAFRLLKFRAIIHQKCLIRRRRRQALLESQKVVVKQYYFDEIKKPQAYTTIEIIKKRGETPILLKSIHIDSVLYEWILVLPYQDIVVTAYSIPRQFYQIKYNEYTNHYMDIVLSESVEKIQQYFSYPIEKFHPSEKVEFITELREQFSKKVIRIVRLKLFLKKIKDTPVTKKFLIRTFVNEFYVQINYFYNKVDQKIIILLQKEKRKRKYLLDLHYLDCFFGNYHGLKYLDKEMFIKLLTLNEPKSYHKYRILLMPMINVLHLYIMINAELDLQFQYKDFEIPLTEEINEKFYTSSQGFYMITNESQSRLLPTIISLQAKWRLCQQQKKYQLMLFRCTRMKIKMMNKKGKEVQKTFLRRKDISDDKESDIMYICSIYQSKDHQVVRVRVELRAYKSKQEQELFNCFTIEPYSILLNEQLSQYVLKNIYIENNILLLRQNYTQKIEIPQEFQQKQLKLITKKPSSPKLIYHQKRQYSQGKQFIYDAIHTGEMPQQQKTTQETRNMIKIDIDLKELKSQYPGVNYKQTNILSQLSEQLITGFKVDKQTIISKPLQKRGIKIQGNCQNEEKGKELNIAESVKQQNTLLLRFTQFYNNLRYMIVISQLDIPIEGYEKLDSVYEPYHSYINITAQNQLNNNRIIWQMNLQQANKITNQQDLKEIAATIKLNILVLEDKFVYVADFEIIEFDYVLMIKRNTMNVIQRMLKNKKFNKLRKEFEVEVRQLKESDNQFWNNIIYYGINQFQSNDYFICIGIERRQYLLLAWNIKDYQRYTLTMYKKKAFHEQLEQIRFINQNLEL
ncbi:unnamed protein product (macronuclear) [Paramecium tetraurelia]|uniref:IQ calmodulin-binding motif family protein n=1 Tax=Paramecium tetraurelia TaxID=5888 RepID=A0CKH6_PARTE|nr:uncharacterized protein GSPATT00001007001 [Paramecium tetraurelia]CAK71293.1 unnamed protein product [Paramecium tetraurelia]|eukprot:XP_001438690.1 hypothetical protein (macronuclear) [Paramecium tetraurelia strain d4-2]